MSSASQDENIEGSSRVTAVSLARSLNCLLAIAQGFSRAWNATSSSSGLL